MVYWLFRLTILLTRPLPLWLGYRVAAAVASICYLFFRSQRRALNENMAVVLGSSDQRVTDALGRRAFQNFGRFVIDFIHFPSMTHEEVRRRLVFTQWDELNEAVGSGRGVLIVTMHVGVWDLGAAALAAHDFPINVVVDTFRDAKLDRLVRSSREKLGLKVIPRERVGVGVFRALRRGEILAMLLDIAPEGQETTVEFFGQPARVSSAPARIALRTGAWVVPAMVLRGPEEDQLIRPIIDVRSVRYEATGDEEHDVRALTQQIVGALEAVLRKHPEQWYLFHPLWAPDGAHVTRALLTSER